MNVYLFQKSPIDKSSSQSFHQDLSLPRPSSSVGHSHQKAPIRYFTEVESNSPKSDDRVPAKSTVAKFREMYLSDTVDNAVKKRSSQTSLNFGPKDFGCATLPTKLKQSVSFNRKLNSRRQTSAPQIVRKSPSKFSQNQPNVLQNGQNDKLQARRQVSAPQIGNHQLPDELRNVYEKITQGQKVNLKKDMGPLEVDKWEASPRLMPRISKREAFKPASHFVEVRGYEKAVPQHLCVRIHF